MLAQQGSLRAVVFVVLGGGTSLGGTVLRMATETFDAGTVKQLRADFLMLMKNAERVKDYREAELFAEAVRKFREHVESVIYGGLVRALEREGDEYWVKKIRTGTWGLISNLRTPLPQWGSASQIKYDPGATREEYFAKYQRDAKKWADKLKREARAAWTVLDEYLEGAAKDQRKTIKRATDERVQIEGIPVVLRGYGVRGEDTDADALARFREGLKHYVQRAKRVFPRLLKVQRPIVLRFECDLDEGGRYLNDSIHVCSSVRDVPGLAHVIAHEMGHHLWRAVLSDGDTAFWTAAIRADYGDLDLRDLLKVWPASERSSLWFFDNDELRKKDPIFYLQADSVLFPPNRSDERFSQRSDLEAEIRRRQDAGETMTVPVPLNPITVYATKNPEEAFCEAFGMLVGYGPRAVLPKVLSWLRALLPEVHAEARQEAGLPALVECLRQIVGVPRRSRFQTSPIW